MEVSFHHISPDVETDLASLEGINGVTRQGDKLRLLTDEPSAAVTAVARFAGERGLKIVNINTPGPSLEDVFIQLTGIGPSGREGAGG